MEQVRIGVVGLGRIGLMHALHAAESSAEQEKCGVTALVDADGERARAVAEELTGRFGAEPRVFSTVRDLLDSGVSHSERI